MKADRAQRLNSRSDYQAFESQLERLTAAVSNPKHGFFGPGSMSWRISREPVLLSLGMRPLLLQIAHPKVAQGVADHSNYKVEPLARGFRTFDAVYKIVFGDQATALKVSRMVFRIHDRIRGNLDQKVPNMTPGYVANDPELALWVYATLTDSSVLGYQLYFGELTDEEIERYYEETKIFAELFGVPLSILPENWAAFQRYMNSMLYSDQLFMTETAKDVANSLMHGGHPALDMPMHVYNAIGASLLPERLRAGFGIKYGATQRVIASAAIDAIGLTMRTLPSSLRALPAARAAERRLGIGSKINEWLRTTDRLAVSTVRDVVKNIRVQQA